MRVRRLENRDLLFAARWHRDQSFAYDLPDLTGNNFIARQCVVDEHDQPVLILGARLTAELFLLMDKEWETPRWRFEALRMIHEAMRVELMEKGIEDAHIWVPPNLVKSFGRKLMRFFGWKQPQWTDFVRETGA